MSRSQLRLGLIGCGGITAFGHIPGLCLRDDVDIAYLCDLNLDRAKITKERFSLKTTMCVDDYHAILKDASVHAVIVASWPANHAEIAMKAIKSDRHVLIQKPMTLEVDSAEQLMEAAAKSTKNILALPLMQAIPCFESLRSIMDRGELGSISFARIRASIPGPDDYYADVKEFFHESPEINPPYRQNSYAQDLGSIADMGSYALSAFYYLFGPGVLRFAHRTPPTYDLCTLLVIDMPRKSNIDGATPFCSIETGWEQVRGLEVCTVFGSIATAYIGSTGNLVVLHKDKGEREVIRLESKQVPLPIAPLDAQTRWLDQIRGGGKAVFHETVKSATWVSTIIADARDLWSPRL